MAIRSVADLGHALRLCRQEMALNQQELGDKAHLRQRTVSDIEQGKGGTLKTLFALLTALDLEITIARRRREGFDPRNY